MMDQVKMMRLHSLFTFALSFSDAGGCFVSHAGALPDDWAQTRIWFLDLSRNALTGTSLLFRWNFDIFPGYKKHVQRAYVEDKTE